MTMLNMFLAASILSGIGDGKIQSDEYNSLAKPKYDIVFTNTSNGFINVHGMEFNVKKVW